MSVVGQPRHFERGFELPLCPRKRTFRCAARNDATGQTQTSELKDGESRATLAIYNFGPKYYGVSPYMAFSWPWANARAGGISILPPMISI
jgi:hypothetical protein